MTSYQLESISRRSWTTDIPALVHEVRKQQIGLGQMSEAVEQLPPENAVDVVKHLLSLLIIE